MKFEIHHFHHHVQDASVDAETQRKLALIITLLEKNMATLQDVKDALAKLAADAAADKTAISAQIKTLTDQVAALQAQIAAGGTVSSTDLDGIVSQINDIDTAVQSIAAPAIDSATTAASSAV